MKYLDGALTNLTKPPPFNIRFCEECGEPYGWVPHDSGRKPRFCAPCRFVVTARTHRACMYKYPRTCIQCGISFLSRRKEGICCSKKCLSKYHEINGGLVDVACDTCGKIVRKKKCKLGKLNYCGYECMGLARRKDEPCTNTYESVRTWLARFNRMASCNRCGFDKEPGILVVHHKDRDRENNKMDNLEVLCPNCHAIEHLAERKSGWKGHKSNHPVKIKLRMQTEEKRRAITGD